MYSNFTGWVFLKRDNAFYVSSFLLCILLYALCLILTAKQIFDSKIYQVLEMSEENTKSRWNNLNKDERRVLNNLAHDENVIIKEADKWGSYCYTEYARLWTWNYETITRQTALYVIMIQLNYANWY